MDYSELSAARHVLKGTPNLCSLFRFLSMETWKRLEFAYLRSERAVYETTITQNLLFSIQAFADEFLLPIEVREANNEATNGNDIELLIRFEREWIEFRAFIQAKRISRRGRYEGMEHGSQIESLIKYAKKNQGIPLYMLYNSILPTDEHFCGDASHGCTLVSAVHLFKSYYKKRKGVTNGKPVMKWKIPHFRDLHPDQAVPWDKLVCGIATSDDLKNALTSGGLARLAGRGVKLDGYFTTHKVWDAIGAAEDFLPIREGADDDSGRFILKDLSDQEKIYQFKPKHRIIVSIY